MSLGIQLLCILHNNFVVTFLGQFVYGIARLIPLLRVPWVFLQFCSQARNCHEIDRSVNFEYISIEL